MLKKLFFIIIVITPEILLGLTLPHQSSFPEISPRIFENTINTSVECVRGVLNDGLPEYNLPSFNPLVVGNLTLDLDSLNLPNISGQIIIENGLATDIASFVMTAINGEFVLVPPTFTVTFGLHYDQCAAKGNYKINVTLFDNNIWGEGFLGSGVEDLNVEGRIKAIVKQDGVHVEEFSAPITLEKYNLTITGLYGDTRISQELSRNVSSEVPELINGHPEIFTDVIAPLLIDAFNALVNDDAGIGIIKSIVQKCIIDVVFPPEQK